MLPNISGEFGVVADPELKFSNSGNAWLRLRLAAKDRVRDANGQWTDGPSLFIDAVLNGKPAEHLHESVSKGDMIVITGRLEQNEWTDGEGNKRMNLRIRIEEVGVSVRWNPARTPRTIEANGATATAIDNLGSLGAQRMDDPPF